MTGRNVISVDVQWALQGKTLGRQGYRVLACSAGNLTMANFEEAIGRFSLGTPEGLPQVTISYLTAGSAPERLYYIALAIHKLASEAKTDGGQLTERDDDGRAVVVTNYCCVPYQPLAERTVPYRAMYEAFEATPLHTENGLSFQVELPKRPARTRVIDDLAIRAAALLLTGRPVCVLGARDTSVAERLDFIDTVMSLIPYGFRTRMTAATWTRATNENHRFKLFFSGAPRDAAPPDHLVYWGQPERTRLSPAEHDFAFEYGEWLADEVGRPTSLLSSLTHPRSFSRKEILEALDDIGFRQPDPRELERHRRRQDEVARRDDGEPAGKHESELVRKKLGIIPPIGMQGKFDGEQILIDCARHLSAPDSRQLEIAISRLESAAKAPRVTDEQQGRYREIIREHRLFRHNPAQHSYEAGKARGDQEYRLRKALLKLAFGFPIVPLSYAGYCLVEDSLDQHSPDLGLLRIFDEAQVPDPVVKAIVCRQLPEKEAESKLLQWFSTDVDGVTLLNLLAGDWKRPQHARLFCDVTLDYLGRMDQHYKSADIQKKLRDHSFLAGRLRDLQVGHDQYQISVLMRLLKAAYPTGLNRQDIYSIMVGNTDPPTPALLAAVLLMLPGPGEDADLARENYAFSTVLTMRLNTETSRKLQQLLWSPRPSAGTSFVGDGHPPTEYMERDESGPARTGS